MRIRCFLATLVILSWVFAVIVWIILKSVDIPSDLTFKCFGAYRGKNATLCNEAPLHPHHNKLQGNGRGNRMLIEWSASFSGQQAALGCGRSCLQMRERTQPHMHICRNTKQKVSESQWRPAGPTTHTAVIMMEEYGCNCTHTRTCTNNRPYWWMGCTYCLELILFP